MNNALFAQVANQAIDAELDDIIKICDETDRTGFCIAVIDPLAPAELNAYFGGVDEALSTGSILIRKHNQLKWKSDFQTFAISKALLSWKNKLNTMDIVGKKPYLLRHGDIIFPGGVYVDDIALGMSGLKSKDDHKKCVDLGHKIQEYRIAQFNDWKKNNAGEVYFKLPPH